VTLRVRAAAADLDHVAGAFAVLAAELVAGRRGTIAARMGAFGGGLWLHGTLLRGHEPASDVPRMTAATARQPRGGDRTGRRAVAISVTGTLCYATPPVLRLSRIGC
jgi:hypothetical protein